MGDDVKREMPPLPPGWAWTTLGKACLVIMGQSPPSSTYNTTGEGLPFLQGKAEFGDLYPTPNRWCSEPSRVAEPGDVLISVRAPVGPTNLSAEKYCIGRGLAAIRPESGMPSKYFLYALRNTEQSLAEKATGTTFGAISGGTLRAHEIALAPLPEQERIVAKIEELFSELDAGVTALKRLQAALKRYRAFVLKAACEGRLVPTEAELARADGREYEPADVLLKRILAERRAKWEAEHPGKQYVEPAGPDTDGLAELPMGWCWASVEQIAEVRLGRQRSPSRAAGPNMRRYVRAANVTWSGLNLSDVKEMDFSPEEQETYRLKHGDVLLGEASGSISEVGKPAIWKDELDEVYFQNTLVRVRSAGPSPSYLYVHFLHDALAERFRSIAKGVGIHHLGAGNIAAWIVGVPPIAEQERIVAEVEWQLSVVEELEETVKVNLARAGRLRQAVLKRAFEGKLVAWDPNDEATGMVVKEIPI